MFGGTKPMRDPMLDLLYQLERRMGRMFNEPYRFFNEPFRAFEWTPAEPALGVWTPLVDIFEENDLIHLVAELPGVKPEEVKITVEGNLLTIKGTKAQVAEEKAETVHRYERNYGTFERTFTLPATVAPDKIKAAYANGVLTITLPKLETAKPHLVKVEVTPPAKALSK